MSGCWGGTEAHHRVLSPKRILTAVGRGPFGRSLKPTPTPTPQEKLKYFPVCVSTKPEPEDEAEEGLGGLPSNISSVSSLLLFNTTENLYGGGGGCRGVGRGWPGVVRALMSGAVEAREPGGP